MDTRHIRHGIGAVRPYVHGPLDLPEFLREVLGALEIERHEFGPKSFHVEMQITDSVIVIEAGELPAQVRPWQNSIYVYVLDVDAVYERALAFGAESVAPPADKPYSERQAGFKDSAGNTWWVSTYRRG